MEVDRKKLVSNNFFSGFTNDELDEIGVLCQVKGLNSGDCVIQQDDYDKMQSYQYYVILEGSVSVVSHSTLIAILTAGECFGEVSYLTDNARTALIKAREDGTQLLVINGNAVDERATRDLRYKLMRKIAMTLADRLTRTNEIATLQAGPTEDLENLLSAAPKQPLSPGPSSRPSILSPAEQKKIYQNNAAKVKLMEASDFFKEFSREEILEILSFRNVFIKHKPASEIVRDGDTDRCFFILIKGTAKVVKVGDLLKKLGKGDTFGEMSILDGSPRTADVIAGRDCCTIRVDAIVLEQSSLSLQLKFFKKFSKILADRLESANVRR